MFRITEICNDEKTVTLRLDGKLIDAWVLALENLCYHHKSKTNRTIVLDFSGVTFIDRKGVKMLESIEDDKIRIINCSLFIKVLLCRCKIGNTE